LELLELFLSFSYNLNNMKLSTVALVFLGLVALSVAIETKEVAHRFRNQTPKGWRIVKRSAFSDNISFSIYLKLNNLELLHETFEAVSNPKSPRWGQFLQPSEVEDMVRPAPEVFAAFEQWLSQYDVQYTLKAGSIKVDTTIETASKMFGVLFDQYEFVKTGKIVNRITGTASLPENLHAYTWLVAGISELFRDDIKAFYHNPKTSEVGATDTVITPAVLKSYYGIPSTATVTNKNSYQAIAAFDDYFSTGALSAFQSAESIPTTNVTRQGPDCFPYCDQYESDLDIQYVTAIAEKAKTLFLANGYGNWILQFAEEALALNPFPLVWSISYGYSELDQCEIAASTCRSLGYNSQQYIDATNTYLQQLATAGASVMVADGDDGAPNFGGASGNCPIDDTNYCPLGGCTHTSTTCGGVTIKQTSSGTTCFYPMGIESDACNDILHSANSALNSFVSNNKACNAAIEKDKEKNPHFYSTCQCSALKSLNSGGYQITGYTYSQSAGALFVADYPTSSPYVTSVGATQFLTDSSGNINQEVVCSILTGAIITTGGGFSSFQTAEDYQTQAVMNWYNTAGSTLPPTYSFNTKYRAYPDVAFNGHNYLIYYSDSTSDNCPCSKTVVDGTSCASPAFAGVVTLLNDNLLNAGKTPLGFLNYLLYQMAEESPNTFNDITSGNNYCNRAYCCTYGYTAVKGWDPATGLGSPSYSNFLNYVLQAKGASN
jgi:subtilase family serine protease